MNGGHRKRSHRVLFILTESRSPVFLFQPGLWVLSVSSAKSIFVWHPSGRPNASLRKFKYFRCKHTYCTPISSYLNCCVSHALHSIFKSPLPGYNKNTKSNSRNYSDLSDGVSHCFLVGPESVVWYLCL